MHYFLNIGSNLGQRKLHISRALRALEERFGYFETSHIVESEPWGYDSPNKFLNLAVMIISDLEPAEMLAAVKEIEAQLDGTPHRDAAGGYADRKVDIDIMAADETALDTPELTLPHPRLAQRRFFLVPFAELAPRWRHPLSGLTCDEMLEGLPEAEAE